MTYRALDLAVLSVRPRLLRPYFAIWRADWADSPFVRPSSRETQRQISQLAINPDDLTYGETPLFSAWWVFRRIRLNSNDYLVDLGAGRGRALVAARWFGARALGIELAVEHVDAVSAALARSGIELRVGDAGGFEVRGENRICVFINWTAFASSSRRRVAARLQGLPKGSVVCCATWAIEPQGSFREVAVTRVPFTWGFEPVRIYEKDSNPELS